MMHTAGSGKMHTLQQASQTQEWVNVALLPRIVVLVVTICLALASWAGC
jgi:hypothetical protein